MNNVCIKDRKIGAGQPCYIIAEIGINHNGDINIAKKLIKEAKEAGCDAVKFQKRTVDVVYTKDELEKLRENPFGPTNGDLKRGLEFSKENYAEIDKYCKELDITWFASPWDEASVDFLEEFDAPCYKIASASLTDDGLLKHIKSKNKPIIMSVGMSSEAEVEHAVNVLGQENLILLHTVSTYPAKNENVNLKAIKTLEVKYPNIPIGYSGHEARETISLAAVAMGACIIERHFTLDKNMWGSDQKASIEPQEMKHLIGDIRCIESAMGTGKIECIEDEIPVKEKLRRK
ncbi:N-acetylneuraminate synthase family protein [Aminipila sp.]|uniref:N-acetylneuraminate synthase family protein n=1 Tax=Aminipila sp. TaxID=2060095 RepID=UPI002899B2BA|nr:N-acetylneuraminate synthase family protein [Aminipila sp.]